MKQIILIVLFCIGAYAESFSSTNVQYLKSTKFKNLVDGDSVPNGSMETITLEHVGGWEYGTNFFFIDFSSADFKSGNKHKVYGEWAPKLSLSKITGTDLSYSFIKDIYLAGELNQGDNFRATNIGIATSIDLICFDFLDVNVFSRKDTFNDRTLQLTLAWRSSFNLVKIPLIFEGFIDYYGIDIGSVLLTQPRLMIDGTLLSEKTKNLQIGIELYSYHSSTPSGTSKIKENIPQFIAKWNW